LLIFYKKGLTKSEKACKVIYAVWGKQKERIKKFKKSLSKRAKDDNIIKLSFERDEKIKKVLVKT
jgi:hypothetical protein